MKSSDNMRTVSIRILGLEESEASIKVIEQAYHLRNAIIIALQMAANAQPELYRLLRRPDIKRAILGDQPGGKKAAPLARARVLIAGSLDRELTKIPPLPLKKPDKE